jgi:Trk K+ transport system NAD-binding subunit
MRRSETTGFFEFEIAEGSAASGRMVKEVPWPEGSIVVSIHRGKRLLVATGDQTLYPGDALVVFGDDSAQRRLEERLRPHSEASAAEDVADPS